VAKPKYSSNARTSATQAKNVFVETLGNVAEQLASHDGLETVQSDHIERAKRAIIGKGLNRLPFYQRAEFEITVGGIFVAAAAACPDLLPVFFPAQWLEREAVTLSSILTLFLIGALLQGHGWMRCLSWVRS
jgi:hypothetical protein